MKININNIKINTISNIGSLNIGKTILTRNENNTMTQPPDIKPPEKVSQTEDVPAGEIQAPIPGQIQVPGPGQIQAPVPGQIQAPVPGQIQAPVPGQITFSRDGT